MTLPFNFTRKRRGKQGAPGFTFRGGAEAAEEDGRQLLEESNAGAQQMPVFGQDDTRPPTQPQGGVSALMPDIVGNFVRRRNERPLETRDTSLTTGPTPRPSLPYQGTENEQGEIIAPIGAQSTGETRPRVNNPEFVSHDAKGHPYPNPHAPDGLAKDEANAKATRNYQPQKAPNWFNRILPLMIRGGLFGMSGGDWAGGVGGALSGALEGAIDPKATDRMWQRGQMAEADARLAGSQQIDKAERDRREQEARIGLTEAQRDYTVKRPDLEAAKLADAKTERLRRSLTSIYNKFEDFDPDTNQEHADLAADMEAVGLHAPKKSKTQKWEFRQDPRTGEWRIFKAGESGVSSAVVTDSNTNAPVTTSTSGQMQNERDAANRASRENIAAQSRASQERRTALKISNTGALSARERRTVERRIRTLQAEESRYEATGQHQMALQKRKEREGFEQELHGSSSAPVSSSPPTWMTGGGTYTEAEVRARARRDGKNEDAAVEKVRKAGKLKQ